MNTESIDPWSHYPPILGLVGPLGCGKTTSANALATHLDGRRLSCAGPIREMLVALGIDYDLLTLRKNEQIPWLHGRDSRYLLKTLGTEWGRELVGENVWINSLLRRCDDGVEPIIVDDVRFDNEAAAIKRAGGHLMFIHRPGCQYTYDHPSECGLSDWHEIDAVVCLSMGICVTGPARMYLLPLPRPWWANWKMGRASVKILRRMFHSPVTPQMDLYPLHPPADLAREAARVWDTLISGRLTNRTRIVKGGVT